MKRKNKTNRFLIFVIFLTMALSSVVPTDITYAAVF